MATNDYTTVSTETLEDKPIGGKFSWRDLMAGILDMVIITRLMESKINFILGIIIVLVVSGILLLIVKIKVHDEYLEYYILKSLSYKKKVIFHESKELEEEQEDIYIEEE